MTREILFRGKRLDNGEWVESGSLLRTKNEETGEFLIFLGSAKPAVYIFNTEKDVISVTSLDECAYYRVDPTTVSQFSGLCDKNGKKIFEGDIIEGNNGHISAIMKMEYGSYRPDTFFVLYRNEFGYEPSQNLYGYYLESKNEQMLVVDSPYMKVIGNVHDNPELLEGEG